MMKAFLKKLRNSLIKPVAFKKTYSQSGEDIILFNLFQQLKVEKPTYIDIGAHHPTFLNNTQLFYENGSKGVNIEPDPYLIENFKVQRPLDINFNVGIGFGEESEADFYVMSIRTLNTFSKEEAEKVAGYGSYKIEKVEKVRLIPLNSVLKQYFGEKKPDLISLDIEGLDLEVLKSIQLSKFKKTVFCIETINYTEDNSEQKSEDIFKLMLDNNFFVYADTYINTIFVHKEFWSAR